VNEAGDDLVPGKIHTIRQNYEYWKKFEGRDVELFTWEGKPYRSKQKVFCVRWIWSVQRVGIWHNKTVDGHKMRPEFYIETGDIRFPLSPSLLAANDGFDDEDEFMDWFYDYPDGEAGILHFTDFWYGA
jgi:hypothetical protein